MTMVRRNIDHIVVAVEDLEQAGESFSRLGFTVSPIMHQTTGLSNRLIMFQNTFIELMSGFENLADNMGMLTNFKNLAERREGGIALSFFSADTESDYAELLNRQIDMTSPQSFTRPVPLPDGTSGEVHATVSMSIYPQAPALNFFICTQHRPQFVWIPEWQQHANTARNIAGLTYIATEPTRNRPFVEAFVGNEAAAGNVGSIKYRTARDEVLDFLTPQELERRYAELSDAFESINDDCLTGVSVRVENLTDVEEYLQPADIGYYESDEGKIVVSPTYAHGIFIEFTN